MLQTKQAHEVKELLLAIELTIGQAVNNRRIFKQLTKQEIGTLHEKLCGSSDDKKLGSTVSELILRYLKGRVECRAIVNLNHGEFQIQFVKIAPHVVIMEGICDYNKPGNSGSGSQCYLIVDSRPLDHLKIVLDPIQSDQSLWPSKIQHLAIDDLVPLDAIAGIVDDQDLIMINRHTFSNRREDLQELCELKIHEGSMSGNAVIDGLIKQQKDLFSNLQFDQQMIREAARTVVSTWKEGHGN